MVWVVVISFIIIFLLAVSGSDANSKQIKTLEAEKYILREDIKKLEEELREAKKQISVLKRKQTLHLKKETQKNTTIKNKKMNYDFIAIDFETANAKRLSACALGIAFVRNSEIIGTKKFFICPPDEHIAFSKINVGIHGITYEDVASEPDFGTLWSSELHQYFNNQLVVFHNSSMDLSILKQLFEYYFIKDYNFKYIDTMKLADLSNYSKKIEDLAKMFGIEDDYTHDPASDAKICAKIFMKFQEEIPSYSSFVSSLNPGSDRSAPSYIKKASAQVQKDNLSIIEEYRLSAEDLQSIDFDGKNVCITGEFNIPRKEIAKALEEKGAIIKSGVIVKLDYLVLGTDFGWSKVQKLQTNCTEKGSPTKIIIGSDLENWL